MPYKIALSPTQFASILDRREHLNKKIFQLHNSPLFLHLQPAPTTQTPASPSDYVLHIYTLDPQPALNITFHLYIVVVVSGMQVTIA